MTNDEADITMALPWSMVSSSSDRRHGHMDDGDDDDTDDDTDDDHDDDTDDDNDHRMIAILLLVLLLVLAFLVPSLGLVLVPFWFRFRFRSGFGPVQFQSTAPRESR